MSKIIAITGPSGSGKTTLANLAIRHTAGLLVSQDNYFTGSIFDPEYNCRNFERVQSYEFDLLFDNLTGLSEGKTVKAPIYTKDLSGVTEGVRSWTEIKPAETIIVEGFLVLHDPRIRDVTYPRIFLDVDEEQLIKRRLSRDGTHWEEYCRKVVMPEYRKVIRPIKENATHILDASKPLIELEQELIQIIG